MKRVVFINGNDAKTAKIFMDNEPIGFHAVVLSKDVAETEKVKAIKTADYLVLHPAAISDDLLKQGTSLKLLQLLSAGYDKINLGLCKELQLPVATNGGANAWSVAEHSVAMLLAIYRRLVECDKATRAGNWRRPIPEFTTFELSGKTVGILGAGNIGQKVAERYKAFETNILYYNRSNSVFMEQELNAKKASLEEIAREADIISIHLPLFAETQGLLGAKEIAQMKPNMVIINTGRAELVDQKALIDALQQGKIMAAGLDVFDREPVALDNALLKMSNVLLSPHIAGHSAEGWTRRIIFAWENIQNLEVGRCLKSVVKN